MTSFPCQAFWGGQWHEGSGGKFLVLDPSNGEKIADVADCTDADVAAAVAAASEAFQSWSKTTVKERAAILLRIRDALLRNKEEMATLLTKENGKPKGESLGEIGFAASFFEWFAEEARRQYGETIPSSVTSRRLVTIRQPVGVAALITPWNFPIGMIGRKVSAALAAGCTCVLKYNILYIYIYNIYIYAMQEVGFPKGVVKT
ncbi:UNVERIFIED_CONTAM: hypothetical protein GTU68_048002 [Idotea baltica]|nr:hypothetical protein [Idotea baltica]